jgi:hypothetical protein
VTDEQIVADSVKRFSESLGAFKLAFIEAKDLDAYKAEIRRVIQEARKSLG